MTRILSHLPAVAAFILLGLSAPFASAQGGLSQTPVSGGTGGNTGTGGNGGQLPMNPAGYKQYFNDMTRKSLDASDDEWKIIQPRLEELQVAQMAMWGWAPAVQPKDPPKPDAAPEHNQRMPSPELNDIGKATNELRQALADKNSSPDLIKATVKTLRDAREKALAQKKAAQKKLLEVLSVRQEAVLIVQGTLE